MNSNWQDTGKLVLRIAVAGLMLFHGAFKLTHGIGWIFGMLGPLAFVGYGIYIAEVIAPILIILGYYSRLAALVIAFDMFMAIALVGRNSLWMIKPGGGAWGVEIEAFFLLSALAIFFLGAGKYSVTRGAGKWD